MHYFASIAIILVTLTHPPLQGQGLVSHLGGYYTSYQITSDSVALNILQQAIIHKPLIITSINSYESAYGAATTTIFLEFTSRDTIVVKREFIQFGTKSFYELRFVDIDGSILLSANVTTSDLCILSSESEDNKTYFYSIDLTDFPWLLLEQTAEIQLTFIHKSHKHRDLAPYWLRK